MADLTYADIAPTIAAAVPVEGNAAALVPETPAVTPPVVPTLTKAVVLEVIKYARWLGHGISVPAASAGERTNGPRDIANRVCAVLGPNSVTEAQVLQIIEEWRRYVGWKAGPVAAPIGDIEP